MMERIEGTIERYGLRSHTFVSDKSPIKFVRAEDPLVTTPLDRSFINHEELQLERVALTSALEQAYDAVSQVQGEASSQKEIDRWNGLVARIDDLEAIASVYNNLLLEIENGNPHGKSIVEVAIYHDLALGTEISLHNALRQQVELARRAGVERQYAELNKLRGFAQAPLSSIKIDGIALEDFTDPALKKRSPVAYFQFLAVAQSIPHRDLYDAVLQDNPDPLVVQHPNTFKWNTNTLATKTSFLTGDIQAQTLLAVAKGARQPLADAYINAAKTIEGVSIVREKALRAIMNPADNDSGAIREIANVFMKSPQTGERNQMLVLLGLNKLPTIYSAYRQSYRISSQHSDDFYFDFAMAVREYTADISVIKDILTDEDIDSFLIYNDDLPTEVTIVDQLRMQAASINQLTSQTSQKFFELNPSEIDVGGLVAPQLVEVELDKNRPRKFTMSIVYNNELDEEVELEFTADTTKETLEWNFLEDPMRPETVKIVAMRDQLSRLATNILAGLAVQETLKRQANTSAKTDQIHVPTTPRERFEDPMYELRKKLRTQQRIAKAQETKPLEVVPVTQKSEVKKVIKIDDASIERKIRPGIDNMNTALEAIGDFNERGVGEFRRKSKRGSDGTPRYTLRVGNMRVLVRETEGAEGIRNFEVLDIRKREDVYSKNDL